MRRGRAAFVFLTLVTFGSCITPGDYRLNVPYRAQVQFNYCAAASVLMWRLYGGGSEISRDQIFNWMGGAGCTNQLAVRDAVNYFTYTHDAFWDYSTASRYQEIVSRQITSIDHNTPVIAIVNGNHTGVVTGGQYHEGDDHRWVWDYVLFHDPDPAVGPNVKYDASTWIFRRFCTISCEQIVSYSQSGAWSYNLSTYGNDVVIGGGSLTPQNSTN